MGSSGTMVRKTSLYHYLCGMFDGQLPMFLCQRMTFDHTNEIRSSICDTNEGLVTPLVSTVLKSNFDGLVPIDIFWRCADLLGAALFWVWWSDIQFRLVLVWQFVHWYLWPLWPSWVLASSVAARGFFTMTCFMYIRAPTFCCDLHSYQTLWPLFHVFWHFW